MSKLTGNPFSVRLKRSTHEPLVAVAKLHRRSQASMIDWLVAEEYERLLNCGKLQHDLTHNPRQSNTRKANVMYKVTFLQNGESGWQPASVLYDDLDDAKEFIKGNDGYYKDMKIEEVANPWNDSRFSHPTHE